MLGRFFDSVGRKPMIAGTYILSGVLLIVTAFVFTAISVVTCLIFLAVITEPQRSVTVLTRLAELGVTDLGELRVEEDCLRLLNRRQAWQFHVLPTHRDEQ